MYEFYYDGGGRRGIATQCPIVRVYATIVDSIPLLVNLLISFPRSGHKDKA